MIEKNPNGDLPLIDQTAYVHPTAVIIGKVRIGRNVFIGPQVVIRADEPQSSIVVGDHCNIQDRVIIHALKESIVDVGGYTSLSHGCIIHGPCRIAKNCFIGFGSAIFNARLGEDVFVHLLAVVSGVDVPPGRMVPDGAVINAQQKAKLLKYKPKASKVFSEQIIQANINLVKGYKQQEAFA